MTVLDNGNVGIGTSTPTTLLQMTGTVPRLTINSTGTADLECSINFLQNSPNWPSIIGTHTSGGGVNVGLQFKMNGALTCVMNSNGSTFFGSVFTIPTSTVHIKGSGSTGATTSLLVQNSAGTSALTITDDRVVTIGNYIAFANGDLIVPSNSSGALELRPIVSKVLLKGATAINTTAAMPVASAMLDIVSTTSGFLPPRMTTAQKNAIATPAAGLVVYDTTLAKLCVYTTAWETITSV